MARPSPSRGSRLTAEERLLEKQRAEILRQQQELEKKLKRLPVQLAEKQEHKRIQAHRRAVEAGPAISSRLGHRGRGKSRSGRLPSRERWAAQVKTIILIIALAVIFGLLWQAIPRG